MRSLVGFALLPALFALHSGWHASDTKRSELAQAPPPTAASKREAGRQRFRGGGAAHGLPHDLVAVLPRDGIVLQVNVSVRATAHTARPAGAWPPRIPRQETSRWHRGSPRHVDGVYQLFARVGRIETYVWAFFGRAHPTAQQLAAANAELTTIQLRR